MTTPFNNGPSGLGLDELIDGQRLRGASILFILIAALATASDGYDLSSLGYIAPELLKQWHLHPTALVPALSAGIIGMMIGGPTLGMLGDRYGRKPIIVGALVIMAVINLLLTQVHGTGGFIVGRFVVGIMIGGIFPNAGALIAELMPRPIRGRVIVIASMGVILGIASPGLVANRLVPTYGWPVILVVGATAQLLVAALVALLMPESIKYLVERGGRSAQVLAVARRLRPDLTLHDDSVFTAYVPVPTSRGCFPARWRWSRRCCGFARAPIRWPISSH